jgi:hypothetical protein
MSERLVVDGPVTWAGHGRRRLSFDEVVALGLPAFYESHGDRLLYLNGSIFDASDPASLVGEGSPLMTGGGLQAVGIEFGWRHADDCSCACCSPERAA